MHVKIESFRSLHLRKPFAALNSIIRCDSSRAFRPLTKISTVAQRHCRQDGIRSSQLKGTLYARLVTTVMCLFTSEVHALLPSSPLNIPYVPAGVAAQVSGMTIVTFGTSYGKDVKVAWQIVGFYSEKSRSTSFCRCGWDTHHKHGARCE